MAKRVKSNKTKLLKSFRNNSLRLRRRLRRKPLLPLLTLRLSRSCLPTLNRKLMLSPPAR